MTYHVMSAGYDAFTPVGATVGGILYGIRWRPFPSVLAMMGTGGLIGGSLGMVLGLTTMQKKARQGESASPPWNDEGIQQRVDGLSHNFKVRVLDLSAWAGVGVAAGAMVLAGGPKKFKFSPGILGVMQGLSLGSALGSLGAIGCIFSTRPKFDEDEDE